MRSILKVMNNTKEAIGSPRRWDNCDDDAITLALGSAPETQKQDYKLIYI